ncbi:MAG: hypothetical protein FVQ81_00090 [Candidatus Glassbacteria bacterium]|nr:hypothetical protein [Candidatus Glassbacteria bacterium]
MADSSSGGIFRPGFVEGHYRGIIVSLVLLNTALIMFLIVYIWTFAPAVQPNGGNDPIAAGVVLADRLIMWSEPGGLEHGAESRGVAEKGSTVEVLRGQRFEDELWLEVLSGERRGWIPENDVDYAPRQQP